MPTRRVLITGGTGLLGKHLIETAPHGWETFATFRTRQPPDGWQRFFVPLDVRDGAAVERLFDERRPEVVIHTASIGGVDEAERDPQGVYEVNVRGTQHVGRACARVGATLVLISSNAVFDGRHPPYDEEAPLCAVNRYGVQKIEAEEWIRRHLSLSAIVRPILMYGWPLPGGRTNVVTRWLAQLEEGRPVDVDEEITTQPLWAGTCAQAVWAVVLRERAGTYHVAGADRLSLLEVARFVARVFGHDERLVQPASKAFLSRFAPRPCDTSFVTVKMERELGVRPIGIQEGLRILQQTRARQPGVAPCAC